MQNFQRAFLESFLRSISLLATTLVHICVCMSVFVLFIFSFVWLYLRFDAKNVEKTKVNIKKLPLTEFHSFLSNISLSDVFSPLYLPLIKIKNPISLRSSTLTVIYVGYGFLRSPVASVTRDAKLQPRQG